MQAGVLGVNTDEQAVFSALSVHDKHHRMGVGLAYVLNAPSHQQLALGQHCIQIEAVKGNRSAHG